MLTRPATSLTGSHRNFSWKFHNETHEVHTMNSISSRVIRCDCLDYRQNTFTRWTLWLISRRFHDFTISRDLRGSHEIRITLRAFLWWNAACPGRHSRSLSRSALDDRWNFEPSKFNQEKWVGQADLSNWELQRAQAMIMNRRARG